MNLALQEATLAPGTEWRPPSDAWWFVRVVHGAAYWLGHPTPLGQDPGSLLVVPGRVHGYVRASQLASTRIVYFGFVPDTIVGVFTVMDRQQVALPTLPGDDAARVLPPGHPLAIEFSSLTSGRIAHTSLLFRCQLLGFAVRVLNSLESTPATPASGLTPVVVTRRLEILVKNLSEADLVRLRIPTKTDTYSDPNRTVFRE